MDGSTTAVLTIDKMITITDPNQPPVEIDDFDLFIDDGNYYTFTLNDKQIMDSLLGDKSPELRSLDVAILHAL